MNRTLRPHWLATAAALLLAACASSLPDASPPLADFDEPLDLRAEPADEAARAGLPAGCFSGLEFATSGDSLQSRLAGDEPLRIARVIENSPAEAAGLAVDDLLLGAWITEGRALPLRRPSDWRRIELEAPAGTTVQLVVDRAGREAKASVTLVPRVRPAARQPAERFREEARVGVVVRTATEVEARAAGLPPGAGAVVVGLSRSSPWRSAGIAFGDLLVALDDAPLAHPQDLLQLLRDPARDTVRLTVVRGSARTTVQAALSARNQDLREVWIPLLFSYRADRGATDWDCLLGLLGYRSTAAAWRCTLLWLIDFGGGDADTLLEVAR